MNRPVTQALNCVGKPTRITGIKLMDNTEVTRASISSRCSPVLESGLYYFSCFQMLECTYIQFPPPVRKLHIMKKDSRLSLWHLIFYMGMGDISVLYGRTFDPQNPHLPLEVLETQIYLLLRTRDVSLSIIPPLWCKVNCQKTLWILHVDLVTDLC